MKSIFVIVLIGVAGVACGGADANGDADRQGSARPQSGSSTEPTVWNAINEPHANLVLLQCRGGAGFEYKSIGYKSAPDGVRVAVEMRIAAGTRSAGSRNENLEPGTCAASDRSLAATEPREIRFITAGFSQPFIGPIDITPTAAEYHPDVRSIAVYLKDPHHYWTFNAVDTHRGYFDTTTHQYWKDFGASSSSQPPAAQNDAIEIARWLVRITIEGGMAGTKREISVNAAGRLQASSTQSAVRCSAELPTLQIQRIEAAIARSHPDTWRPAYVKQNNPNGCCDQFTSRVHVEQEDAQGRRTERSTYWFNDSADTVPEDVIALFKSVYEARMACSALGS